MFNNSSVKLILEGIRDLNTKMGIWAFIIPVTLAVVVIGLLINCYRNPSRKSTAFLLGAIAVVYIFAGATILAGINKMGVAMALIGAIGLWSVGVLLIVDIIFDWTRVAFPKTLDLQIISLGLMFAGIFFYPILELLLGFKWPGIVFFGAECPSTIFLIGLLIGAIPRVNAILFILISINAVMTGFSVAIHGAAFDFLYGIAGIIGITMILIYFKKIFLKKEQKSNL